MRALSKEPGAWLAAALLVSIPLFWIAAPVDERMQREACASQNISFCLSGLGASLLPTMSVVIALVGAIALVTMRFPRERAWGRWATLAWGLLVIGYGVAGLVDAAMGARVCENDRCATYRPPGQWIFGGLCLVAIASGVAYLRLAWLSRPTLRGAPRSPR